MWLSRTSHDEILPERTVMGIPVFNGTILIAVGVFISVTNSILVNSTLIEWLLPLCVFGGAGSVFMILAILLPKPTRIVITLSMICGGLFLAVLGISVLLLIPRALGDRAISVTIVAITIGMFLQIDWLVRLFSLQDRMRRRSFQGFEVITTPENPAENRDSNAR
jgi:hypothetical protein